MSGRKPPVGRKSGRHPTDAPESEDLELWSRVAETIKPLRKGKGRVHRKSAVADSSGARVALRAADVATRPVVQPSPQPRGSAPARVGTATAAKPRQSRPEAVQPAAIERKHARRIAKGQLEIEARLDLHGLTQAAAHRRLVGFLQASAAKGLSHVLVITGKGGERSEGEAAFGDMLGGSGRGVLRRAVPRWLAEPELGALVIGFGPAAVRHGGDGALYVRLRKRR